jgi:hypothetical protein
VAYSSDRSAATTRNPSFQQEFSGNPFLSPCPVGGRNITDQLAQVDFPAVVAREGSTFGARTAEGHFDITQ